MGVDISKPNVSLSNLPCGVLWTSDGDLGHRSSSLLSGHWQLPVMAGSHARVLINFTHAENRYACANMNLDASLAM